MKQLSFFLFVATGLILCATLHAQQYHDAAAFGLKGNVKECKVVSAEDGSASYDPHLFSTVSFTREGKLVSWFDDPRRTKDLVLGITDVLRNKNQQPLIFEHKESSYKTEAYYFQYKGEQLAGSYILSWEDDDIFGRVEDTRVAVISEGANNSLTERFFGVGDVVPDFTKLIRQELYNGGDILPRLEKYVNENMSYVNEYRSFTDNYTIEGRDSHGNYTILANEDGASIKRIITYWDDEPASNYSITSTAPGIKLSTSKELTLKDLISKPLGVIENPSKSLWGIDPEKVIEYTQENKEWKCTESYGIYSIKEGFNWTFKGYPLDVDVRKYKYVNYSYGYGYYVTMGYKDQETKEAASREMEKLFNIVVQEFRDLGIELTQSQGKSWIRAEKTIGDMHYLVALNKPVEIDGKVLNQEYYVSIGIDKPL